MKGNTILKLKLGKHQIFVVDENNKICQVFYNFNKAKEYIEYEEHMLNFMAIYEDMNMEIYDKYDFHPYGCGWLE